ncbi:hypothetical protein ILUMI_09241, partial [Ignelater luminosus]
GNRQAMFDKFDNSCGLRNLPIVFSYTGIRTEGSKLLINCSITAKKDISKDPKMVIRIERCRNKENLDTCEPFHVYSASSYCTTTSTFAGGFVKSFVPEWKCPITKGVYRATNAELDTMAFFMFPVETWYWKVVANILDSDTDKVLMCVTAEMHMKRIA